MFVTSVIRRGNCRTTWRGRVGTTVYWKFRWHFETERRQWIRDGDNKVTGVNVFISRRTFTIVLKNWLIMWVADGNSFDMSLVWWLSASKDPRSLRTGPSFHGGTWSSVRKIKGFLGFHYFLFAYFLCMQSSGTAIGLLALEIKSLRLIVLQNLLIFLPWFFFWNSQLS